VTAAGEQQRDRLDHVLVGEEPQALARRGVSSSARAAATSAAVRSG
jgi:hypothetical protein